MVNTGPARRKAHAVRLARGEVAVSANGVGGMSGNSRKLQAVPDVIAEVDEEAGPASRP